MTTVENISRCSQSIEIDIGNQSIHSISMDINRQLLSINIGNQSHSNSQKKRFVNFYQSAKIDNNQ